MGRYHKLNYDSDEVFSFWVTYHDKKIPENNGI